MLMLLFFFERKCFVLTLLVFFVICYFISNLNNVKIVMLFQFGIMLKTKITLINYVPNAPTYPPPASTVTVQANNLSHSMQIAKGG